MIRGESVVWVTLFGWDWRGERPVGSGGSVGYPVVSCLIVSRMFVVSRPSRVIRELLAIESLPRVYATVVDKSR